MASPGIGLRSLGRYAPMRTLGSSVATSVNVSNSTTANTFGSWTQIIASTPADSAGFIVGINTATGVAATVSNYVFQVGIGANPNETSLVTIQAAYSPVTTDRILYVPIFVPAASRLTIRTQRTSTTALAVAYNIELCGMPPMGADLGCSYADTYGFTLATTLGVPCGNITSTNTKMPWVSLGTLSRPATWVQLRFGGNGVTAMGAANVLLDLGYLRAGETINTGLEKVIVPDLALVLATSETIDKVWDGNRGPYEANLPSGSQMVYRVQASVATNNIVDASVICYG